MRHFIVLSIVVLSVVGSDAVAQTPSPGGQAGGLAPDLSGTTFGFPLLGGGVNARVSVTAGQSFSRSMSTNAALVTVPNGVPGFVFGGSVQPFVTGLVPFVAAASPLNNQSNLSPVGRMLLRGDIQVQKGSDGAARLVISEAVKPRVTSGSAPVKSELTNAAPNAFRRGLEKYAGPKR